MASATKQRYMCHGSLNSGELVWVSKAFWVGVCIHLEHLVKISDTFFL